MIRFNRLAVAALVPVALAACQQGAAVRSAADGPAAAAPADTRPEPVVRGPFDGQPVAAELTRQEWAKAENRDHCAPLVLTGTGGAEVNARPAEFSGGWAVAFDLPAMRSAYGVAGVGMLDTDNDSDADKRQQLQQQWPYFRELPGLPDASYAGYGVEGAKAYPADQPNGDRLESLAYVRVGGQKCLYNVWSKLGRDHLETLLDSLRTL